MPRRGYKKLIVNKDLLYNSYEVAKFINYVMKDGKRSVAEKIIYSTLDAIKNNKKDPLEVLQQAIENTSPKMEVKPRRIGGASYLVPVETTPTRRLFLSLNWIIQAALTKSNKEFKTFKDKLYTELMDAYNNQGGAVDKKAQVEKLADANKAFAHFKW